MGGVGTRTIAMLTCRLERRHDCRMVMGAEVIHVIVKLAVKNQILYASQDWSSDLSQAEVVGHTLSPRT
jgi:hypothetical protein